MAAMTVFDAELDRRLGSLLPRLVAMRHDLHRHPELGFEERRTQGVVRAWLEEHGYRPRACADTGLVADLHPGAGPTVALRADLDALPIPEPTDLPYRSVHEGKSHKCGHDGHTVILAGAAAVLATRRGEATGNVRFLFQPAEEGVRGGGARVMVAEGALEGVAECYGLHNWPGFPKGAVHVTPGPVMAQVDHVAITLRGRGGHASTPQHCKDPIVAQAYLIAALQTVVSRTVGSDGVAVLTIARVAGGTTHNVIPDVVELEGTLRTFDPGVRVRVLQRLGELVPAMARAHGVEAELAVDPEYPAVVNDPTCAHAVAEVAAAVPGVREVSDQGLPLAAAEDFAYFARVVPSAYFFLGAGDPVGGTPGCHHPDFDFDDDLIPLGVRTMVALAGARLAALT